MRWPRTLILYQCREIALYATLGFVAVIAVLISQNLLRRLDDLVVVGFAWSDVARALAGLFPMLAAYATPIAFLFGVLLAMSRLASDSELLAMRASGLGTRWLLGGPAAVAVGVSLLTAWLMNAVEPTAHRELRTLFGAVAARGGMLEAGKFREIAGRLVYVDARDRDNNLQGVMLADDRRGGGRLLVFAERGRLVFDGARDRVQLELLDGDLHIEDAASSVDGKSAGVAASDSRSRRVHFGELTYDFDLHGVIGSEVSKTRARELTWSELRQARATLARGQPLERVREQDPVEFDLQLHRRLALPVAPLLFAAIAVPLGLRRHGRARSWGALLCLLLVFAYYALLIFAQHIAREGWLHPASALWLPNLIFFTGASWGMHRARIGDLL